MFLNNFLNEVRTTEKLSWHIDRCEGNVHNIPRRKNICKAEIFTMFRDILHGDCVVSPILIIVLTKVIAVYDTLKILSILCPLPRRKIFSLFIVN